MKILWYILGILAIVSGVIFGYLLVPYITAESYVNGDIVQKNVFVQENFSYSATNLTFYHDIYDYKQTYTYEIDLIPVEDFNGENDYECLFNNYYILDAEYQAGEVTFSVPIDFYSTTGTLLKSTNIAVTVEFLADKTTLLISTIGQEESQYLESYFANNGISILINRIV